MRGAVVTAVLAVFLVLPGAAPSRAEDPAVQGGYLVRAAGCVACHTDFAAAGAELSGGRGLKTPFGTFFTPNITPDRETGIGRWNEAQFLAALRHGVRPDGAAYYPTFPYTTYARMNEADARAIYAYLMSRPPVRRPNRPHEVGFPFGWRLLAGVWRWLFFAPGEFVADPTKTADHRRGAYLVTALAHCGECHTPRNALGAMRSGRFLAGTPDGPDGQRVPNITPDKETGIGNWSKSELVELFRTGTKPDFDNVQGSMKEAVEHGLKHLSEVDLEAIATYILAQQPIQNRIGKR
jgi:mono/diheme cytochrome c family protein